MRKAKHAYRSEHTGSGLAFVEGFLANIAVFLVWAAVVVVTANLVPDSAPHIVYVTFLLISLYGALFVMNWRYASAVEDRTRTGNSYVVGCGVFCTVVGALLALLVVSMWPHDPLGAMILTAMGALLCIGTPAVAHAAVRRTRRRNITGACQRCLYSLAGLSGDACPECGWVDDGTGR